MFIKILRFVVSTFINLTCDVTIENLENFTNEKGKVIVTANHLGRLDALMIYYLSNRDDLIIIAAEKYQNVAFFRWLAKKVDALFVDRYNADFSTVRKMLRRINKGGILVIAPEGTRSKTKALQKAHDGAAYIGMKTGIPVVPVGITGSEDEDFNARLKVLKKPIIHVKVGKPIILPPLPKVDREEKITEQTDEIMCQIASLLPEKYRGVYKNHPRLTELLAEG